LKVISDNLPEQNLSEIKSFYENNIYGKWHGGEEVSFAINEVSKREPVEDPDNPFLSLFKLSTTDEGRDIEIYVSNKIKTVSFTVRAYIPEKENIKTQDGRCPFIVCMHPIAPKDYVLKNGYALIFLDTSMVAEDNCLHKGVFYELYPYEKDSDSQTGELMAWSWGAAKVLDAVEKGLDKELGLNAELSMLTGVSRWGKATAVCGAFDKRFKVVIPVCSGAGGLALWKYKSEGKSYDLSFCKGPKEYIYKENEPLSCLQSDAERGWFVDRFLEYGSYEDIEVEQYMLPVLAADSSRYYFIIAAWMGEDWVNAPAMWECYKLSLTEYEKLGLKDNIKAHFHKEGHAVLEEDLAYIFKEIELLTLMK